MPQLIRRLENVNNTIYKDIDLWFDKIIDNYIIDIVVDTIKSYSEDER